MKVQKKIEVIDITDDQSEQKITITIQNLTDEISTATIMGNKLAKEGITISPSQFGLDDLETLISLLTEAKTVISERFENE